MGVRMVPDREDWRWCIYIEIEMDTSVDGGRECVSRLGMCGWRPICIVSRWTPHGLCIGLLCMIVGRPSDTLWWLWFMWCDIMWYMCFWVWCNWSCFGYWSVSWFVLELFCGLLLERLLWFRRVYGFVVDEYLSFWYWISNLEVYDLFWFPKEEVLWSCHLLMNWEILWFCCWFWLLRNFMILMLVCEFKNFRNLWMIYFKICLWLILRDVSVLV